MGPKGINWIEAFQFYCNSVEGKLPSYKDVADRYKVSKTEVGQKALEEEWTRLRHELYEKSKNQFLEDKSSQIAETEDRQLITWRSIQNLTDNLLDEIENNLSLKQVRRLLAITRTTKIAIEGE